MTTTRTAANLAMAMRLPATDPHTLLHANTWGQPEREFGYLGPESIDIPVEDRLGEVQTFRYQILDLASGTNVNIFPDEASRMLVRDDYSELHRMIEEDRSTPGRQLCGMVVTGHPGIGKFEFTLRLTLADRKSLEGKSFFLFYYLFKNLIASQPTALQTNKNSFLLFVKDGVYLIRFSSNTAIYDVQSQLKSLGCKNGIIALVDSSEKIPVPAPVFTDSRFPFYVVQATAPRSYRWLDWLEQRSASVIVAKPCSWAEVYTIWFVNQPQSTEVNADRWHQH